MAPIAPRELDSRLAVGDAVRVVLLKRIGGEAARQERELSPLDRMNNLLRVMTGGQDRAGRLIDAANRLPRPVLVYGTVALMFLALVRPDLFDRGMASLDRMPDELWWLVGAILAGHFGAREAHHMRHCAPPAPPPAAPEKPGSDSPT